MNEGVMRYRIPMLDLSAGIAGVRQEIDAAVRRVIDAGNFVNGPDVAAFERELGDYLGVAHCVGVNSGTDALIIGLRALGVAAGDEVLVPAFTFFATAEAVSAIGAMPVFVDIDPRTFNIDAAQLEARLTQRTRAVIPVHLYGQAANMDAILQVAQRHGLWVLEDVAQALGGTYRQRKLGSLGHAAAFSFFPSKNLGAFGDGGLLATNDTRVAALARELRQHGGADKYENERIGYNSRLDTLQAAVLRVKLPRLDAAIALRRAAAARYDELMKALPNVRTPWRNSDGGHAFNQYTVRLDRARRDAIRGRLADAGIQTEVYYPTPLHQLPVYRSGALLSLPMAEAAGREVLSLPIWPEIEANQQVFVADALRQALK
jgi:dTDP-4-amino-4,6-dideoxygalactose transaminase